MVAGSPAFTGIVAGVLGGLALLTLALLVKLNPLSSSLTRNEEFAAFQRRYLGVLFMVMAADWLTGPYLFRLYESYGFLHEQIAALFICGYVSSLAFGPMLGGLADTYGRKRLAIVFCWLFSLSCLLKLSSSFFVLLVGRFLGGISTSLLLSTFESWMVAQHNAEGFPSEWLPRTLALATFGNGVVACLAGVVANVVADCCGHHPVRPFLLAIAFLVPAALWIGTAWEEHRVSDLVEQKHHGECAAGLRYLVRTRKVWLLGLVQSAFESAMYVFVFLWTPSIDAADHPPLGLIFASFMLAIMIGSALFRLLLDRGWTVLAVLKLALQVAVVALTACALLRDRTLLLFAFLLFEASCGLFFPAIGTLKGELLPEAHRAGIMNWYRVPTNTFVVAFLLGVGQISHAGLFLGSAGLVLLGYFAHAELHRVLSAELYEASKLARGDVGPALAVSSTLRCHRRQLRSGAPFL